jgi:acylphosphatase
VKPAKALVGRRFSAHGRVQGVGFRDFVQREARRLGLTGYTRNLADGSVLVCAVGTTEAISELEGIVRQGPRWAEVRGLSVEEMEAQPFDDFRIVG